MSPKRLITLEARQAAMKSRQKEKQKSEHKFNGSAANQIRKSVRQSSGWVDLEETR